MATEFLFSGNLVDLVDPSPGLFEISDALLVALFHGLDRRLLLGDFLGIVLWVVFRTGDFIGKPGFGSQQLPGALQFVPS